MSILVILVRSVNDCKVAQSKVLCLNEQRTNGTGIFFHLPIIIIYDDFGRAEGLLTRESLTQLHGTLLSATLNPHKSNTRY